MPKSTLTAYKTKARHFSKLLKAEPQRRISQTLNISQQMVSYNLKHQRFTECFETTIRLLDMLGYEIKEKDEEEQ